MKPRARGSSRWERVAVFALAAVLIAFLGYLVWRNAPFSDPTLAVAVRTLLSLSVAAIGGLIPGFLKVGWGLRGLTVRASGALALFVLTYVFTPHVVTTAAADPPYLCFAVPVPKGATVATADYPGSIEITENALRPLIEHRAQDQAVFALLVRVPGDLGHASDYDQLSQDDKDEIDRAVDSRLALQAYGTLRYAEGSTVHEVEDVHASRF